MTAARQAVPATVVVPTIGRRQLLRNCLASLVSCDPRAEEIVVVDQSHGSEIEALVAEFAPYGARTCTDRMRGRGRAVNVGMSAASNDLVLATDDDCTVAPDWVAVAKRLSEQFAGTIVTGRVLPAGDYRAVPSTIVDEKPRDYTGTVVKGGLYRGNMACSRRALLAFGGFDENVVPNASDNEFCFRWLKAGRGLRYEPDLVVWHHAWRTPEQMEQLYRDYARGEGVFYGKHLRAGEMRVLRYLLSDLRDGVRGQMGRMVYGGARWWDWRLGVLPWTLVGLVEGFRSRSASAA